MGLSREKVAFLEGIFGEPETDRILARLTRLERELKASGVEYKETDEGLLDLLTHVFSGEATEEEIRKILGGRIADEIVAVVNGEEEKPETKEGAKDTLSDLTAVIKRLQAIIKKLEAAPKPQGDITPDTTLDDDDNANKDHSHPTAKYALALKEGRVVRGGS